MIDRIRSIDAFRALTMLLMIWVNDFWSLNDIPTWLLHVSADTDGMGFSDIIFPTFLFIVGLSIPFALKNRISKGDTNLQLVGHILKRSGALIFMGVLMVNLESYHDASPLLPKPLWQVLMTIGFILIWNIYPKTDSWTKRALAFRCIGWGIMVFLLATFRSDPQNGYNWIEPHWWGILGLIGWSYLICSIVMLATRDKAAYAFAAWLMLSLANVAIFAGWTEFLEPVRSYIWIVGDGSLPALTMSGCVVALLYLHSSKASRGLRFCLFVAAAGLVCIAVGFAMRPLGGISKIHATPSWTQICTGLAMVGFAFTYYLVDLKGIRGWYRIIAPAGAATLTCYLLPYLAYPFLNTVGIDLPAVLTTGTLGLLKSLLFAFAIVGATGLINRFGVKLGV
ncbi:DUF5009 domain-containing protein [Pelagicoccus sp. SDUM812002]|uniref:heparan-alpha-glucosaminide N-acetyltransferase domain-containing protein n=1 Tax=Pelagicoccus sp. SDUM812002 TaxID=3041266 RepID=UPI00280FD9AF|nr:DUF5009 domain-containing protein [Pelagicoccus sp. SDUM812002]MDQ8183979.1 DUF5009 domain-containing protein [Pelagicoccus sp. SDUM812002]